MAAFNFVALDQKGKQHKGVLEGDSERQIRQLIRERHLIPLSVISVAGSKQSKATNNQNVTVQGSHRTIKNYDLALITRQLATLISAGLPVEEALKATAAQNEHAKIKTMLLAIRSKIMEGFTLADGMEMFPRAFPKVYRATVAAGEHAGHLGPVLDHLADYTEAREQTRQKIQLAMLYPLILSTAAIVIIAFLLGYVVPDVIEVFADTGQDLPLLTTLLLVTSNFVKNFGFAIILGITLVALAAKHLLRQPSLRLILHRHWLDVPFFGNFTQAIDIARFTSTLDILTRSGVPLVEALIIASRVLSNDFLKHKVEDAAKRVREGSSLHSALEQCGHFPPMLIHMVASGESSGKLDDMLKRAARNLERDLENRMAIIVGLFEPFMLLFMGGVVLLIVLAILLPILNMNQLVG